tara:strand:+ start:250 stop:822 length:573 start_codon:yes stop_codon:yes gene_type:complete
MKKLILIDNYDSFTYNLLHYAQSLGAEVEVLRNDADSAAAVLARGADGIILSPGPATPNESGICLELIEKGKDKVPMFGVCLGHQAIGQVFGGEVVRMSPVMHGKTSLIRHTGEGVFKGLNNPFTATRYHSLIVKRETLPDCLSITAETEDGTIMGLQHTEYPLHSVQFHPESIASEHGHDLLRNFLELL